MLSLEGEDKIICYSVKLIIKVILFQSKKYIILVLCLLNMYVYLVLLKKAGEQSVILGYSTLSS